MDFKKTNAPASTVTRDLSKLDTETGNVYESVMIIGKRANKISQDMKHELNRSWRSLLTIPITLKRFSRTVSK